MFRHTLRTLTAIGRLQTQLTVVPSRSIKRWVSPTMRELRKRRAMMGPEPAATTKRANFVEWNLNAELYAFGQRLGEPFEAGLLQQAFTHRSYIVQEELRQQEHDIEQPETNLRDNGELIESGRRLIGEHTELFVRAHFPRLPAAGVQAVCAHLCSEAVLANVSAHLGTRELILAAEYPVEAATLATTLQAIVGALAASSDSSADRVFEFVRDFVCTQLSQADVNTFWHIERPLELLQQLCADQPQLGAPEPRLIGDAGTNTLLACYRVGIYASADKRLLGTGFGENVDTAIAVAARNCLAAWFATGPTARPLNFRIGAAECYQLAQQDGGERRSQKLAL